VDVTRCKIYGLKTHDCHVIFQKLLPIAVRNILPQEVVIPLIELVGSSMQFVQRS